jgi:hypothetical protein
LCKDYEELSAQQDKVSELIELSVAPRVVGYRTFVPLRAISEGFGVSVDWNEALSTVRLTCPQEFIDAKDADTTFTPKFIAAKYNASPESVRKVFQEIWGMDDAVEAVNILRNAFGEPTINREGIVGFLYWDLENGRLKFDALMGLLYISDGKIWDLSKLPYTNESGEQLREEWDLY